MCSEVLTLLGWRVRFISTEVTPTGKVRVALSCPSILLMAVSWISPSVYTASHSISTCVRVPPVLWTVRLPVEAVSSERVMAVGERENTPPGLSLADIVTTALSWNDNKFKVSCAIGKRWLVLKLLMC